MYLKAQLKKKCLLSRNCLFVISIFFATLFWQLGFSQQLTLSDLNENYPLWMKDQIYKDLSDIKNHSSSTFEIDEFFHENAKNLYLIKLSILNNQLFVENYFKDNEGVNYRLNPFIDAINELCRISQMPNVVFLISMHDGLGTSPTVPIFVMSKRRSYENLILVPDFEALRETFQVLHNKDITKYLFPWSKKYEKLIWRGSTAQRAIDDESYILKKDNVHSFSRVLLCQLSVNNPKLIDARFTYLAQLGEEIPYINKLVGSKISFEKQFTFKYHILIDGNVCAYSGSGWKFFTNSLVFKADSKWIQWYYDALIPYYHYVPVKNNLEDLVEKVIWARNNDGEAEIIARNSRNFAIQNLTQKSHLTYMYHLINEYSQCIFIKD